MLTRDESGGYRQNFGQQPVYWEMKIYDDLDLNKTSLLTFDGMYV